MNTACVGCHDNIELPFEFRMAFQPIVDLGAQRIWGYEALVRGVNGESAYSILSQVVSVALRPLRIFVLSPESTARRVFFCKGAHNGRPFGRHKTTVVIAYRSVRRRRSKALAGRFEGTDCRGKPRAGGDCHRCRASPWVPAPAGARLAAPGAFGPVGTAGFGGHAVVRAGGIGIGATGGRRAHRVAGSSRCDG